MDTTNWSYNLYRITEVNNDTIPSYKIDNLKERYNESLLKRTDLTMKGKKDVMRKLNITQIKSKCRCPSLLIEANLCVKSRANPVIA